MRLLKFEGTTKRLKKISDSVSIVELGDLKSCIRQNLSFLHYTTTSYMLQTTFDITSNLCVKVYVKQSRICNMIVSQKFDILTNGNIRIH